MQVAGIVTLCCQVRISGKVRETDGGSKFAVHCESECRGFDSGAGTIKTCVSSSSGNMIPGRIPPWSLLTNLRTDRGAYSIAATCFRESI